MAALTEERDTPRMGNAPIPNNLNFPVAAAVKIYNGSLVSIDSSGNARPARATSTDTVVGRATDTVDNTAGSAGDLNVEVEQGVFAWENSSSSDEIAADDVGKICYVVNDQTVALTSSSSTRPPAGVVVRVDGDGVHVESHLSLALPDSPADLEAELAATTTGLGASKIGVEDSAGRLTAADGEAALAEIAGRVLGAAASETAIKAIPAAARGNGTMVVDLTNDAIWTFDSGSSASASAWVLVPDAGTGRWLRNHVSLADLSSTANAKGASLSGVEDSGSLITATTVEAALGEAFARHGMVALADPGDGVAIPVTRSASIALTFDGTEANTLAVPTFAGQRLTLTADVATSGSRAVTVAADIDQSGNNLITFDAAGEFVELVGVQVAGGLVWRLVQNVGATLA